jgi:hypothetical protein
MVGTQKLPFSAGQCSRLIPTQTRSLVPNLITFVPVESGRALVEPLICEQLLNGGES